MSLSKNITKLLTKQGNYNMEAANYHYSNYLISAHFDYDSISETLADKKQRCTDFLSALGKLARASGVRLFSTFSITNGKTSPHAHFGLNWLPSPHSYRKTNQARISPLARAETKKLLESHGFYVDNPTQAIKRVTHDKKMVTEYIIMQPKKGQKTEYSGFYSHPVFGHDYSYDNPQSYCNHSYFDEIKIAPQNGCQNKIIATTFLMSTFILAISYLLLAVF